LSQVCHEWDAWGLPNGLLYHWVYVARACDVRACIIWLCLLFSCLFCLWWGVFWASLLCRFGGGGCLACLHVCVRPWVSHFGFCLAACLCLPPWRAWAHASGTFHAHGLSLIFAVHLLSWAVFAGSCPAHIGHVRASRGVPKFPSFAVRGAPCHIVFPCITRALLLFG